MLDVRDGAQEDTSFCLFIPLLAAVLQRYDSAPLCIPWVGREVREGHELEEQCYELLWRHVEQFRRTLLNMMYNMCAPVDGAGQLCHEYHL